jgi:peptide/nickel transport system ATP-binding protein
MVHKTARLSPIPGLMPDPTYIYKGCPFADRCPHCMEKCKHEKPAFFENGTHRIKCHLYTGEAKEGV